MPPAYHLYTYNAASDTVESNIHPLDYLSFFLTADSPHNPQGLKDGRKRKAIGYISHEYLPRYTRTRIAKIKYLPPIKKGKGRTRDRERRDEMNELVEYRFCILMVIRR